MERRCSKSTIWTLVAFCVGAIVVVGGSATAKESTIIGLHEPGTGGYQTTGNTAGDDEGSGWTAGTSGGSSGGGSSGGSSGGGSSGGGSSGGGTSGGGSSGGGTSGGDEGSADWESYTDPDNETQFRSKLPAWFSGSRNETRLEASAPPGDLITAVSLTIGRHRLISRGLWLRPSLQMRFRFDSTKFNHGDVVDVVLDLELASGRSSALTRRRRCRNVGVIFQHHAFFWGGYSYDVASEILRDDLKHIVLGSKDSSWNSGNVVEDMVIATAAHVNTHGPDLAGSSFPYFQANSDADLVYPARDAISIATSRKAAADRGFPPIHAALLDACYVAGDPRRPNLAFGKAFLIDHSSGRVRDSICRFQVGWRIPVLTQASKLNARTFWGRLGDGSYADEVRIRMVEDYNDFSRWFFRPRVHPRVATALTGDVNAKLGGVYRGAPIQGTDFWFLMELS